MFCLMNLYFHFRFQASKRKNRNQYASQTHRRTTPTHPRHRATGTPLNRSPGPPASAPTTPQHNHPPRHLEELHHQRLITSQTYTIITEKIFNHLHHKTEIITTERNRMRTIGRRIMSSNTHTTATMNVLLSTENRHRTIGHHPST